MFFKRFNAIIWNIGLAMTLVVGQVASAPQTIEIGIIGKDSAERREYHPETGKLSFLGADPNQPILVRTAQAQGYSPQQRSLAIVKAYGQEFGLTSPTQELTIQSENNANGREIIRYQQVYQGIPVLAGELVVHATEKGELISMNGEISPDLDFDVTPAVSLQQAQQTALEALAKWTGLEGVDLQVSTPELWIYDSRLLKFDGTPPALVWRMEVTAIDGFTPLRELVLVDAQRGQISLHFNQVDTTNRKIGKVPSTQTQTAILNKLHPQIVGTTWYVATSGDDSNSCVSVDNPCLTINGAIGKATSGDTILVASGTYTSSGYSVVTISKSLHLSGGWNASFTYKNGTSIIDGQGIRRGISNTSGPSIVDSFIIQNGYAESSGGGVANSSSGTLTINNTKISNNSAGKACCNGGGGIVNNGGTLTLNNSTVTDNTILGGYPGSGISTTSGVVILNNSTVSGNTGGGGEGIYVTNGTAVLNNSTVSGNQSYGIKKSSGTVTLRNTIIAHNGSIGDCNGTFVSQGYNLIGKDSGGCSGFSTAKGDLINIDARLGELIGFPGYIPLLQGSPAIDAGNPEAPGSGENACLSHDQRGVARPVGERCDIGAYEYTAASDAASLAIASGNNQRIAPNLAFLQPFRVAVLDTQGSPVSNANVTFTAPSSGASGIFADSNTGITSAITDSNGVAVSPAFIANNQLGTYTVTASADGVESVSFNLQNTAWYVATTGNDSNDCLSSTSPCLTINAAIAKSNKEDIIVVTEGTYPGGGTSAVTINNKSVLLSGGWDATFTSQTGTSTIDGGGTRTGIEIFESNNVRIDRFSIRNGLGGISAYRSDVIISNSSISGTIGDGIYNNPNSVLILNNSAVSDSKLNASGQANGIRNSGTLRINNSTISGNTNGYGIHISGGTVILNNTTISENGLYGILNRGGNVKLQNTLVAGNKKGTGDCFYDTNYGGEITSSGYNLIGNASGCRFNATVGDLIGTKTNPINPHLEPLQDNGGPTLTFALGTGSPAIDAGNPHKPGTCLTTDQRGVARPINGRCDIGAFEGSVPWTPQRLANTYTASNSSTLPGNLLCNQTQPSCTNGINPDADAAHRYALGVYDFYVTHHAREGIDDKGKVITSTVDYGTNYANAFWNGSQMVYGDGYPLADDVVAHELTHGVTQYESNLFYYYQSGAINESFSDIWGELYDQSNGQGTDTPAVKWLIGEDAPGGAIRSMSNPPLFGDPDAITSPLYFTGWQDNGGVHYNSGVNNKAAFLMVDGGTFNGKTVTALGVNKTLAIYYEAQTNLLTSGSDYADLYNILYQACFNLIGRHGIGRNDCQEVRDATEAVAMNAQPISDPHFNTDVPLCDGNLTPGYLSFYDFETEPGWGSTDSIGPQRWQWFPYGEYAHSGTGYIYADDFPAGIADTSTVLHLVPQPNTYLHFAQAYDFEYGYDPETGLSYYFDGGVLEYSIDDKKTWQDAGPLMMNNGYTGTIYPYWNNPLRGRAGFVGTSHGYIDTRLNLSSLAGKPVYIRWRMGLDDTGYSLGWFVDDVRVYKCYDIPEVTITAKPANPTTATSATFAFTSNKPDAAFICFLNHDPADCVSPITYTNLGWGSHTFQVHAISEGGTGSAIYSWDISDKLLTIVGNTNTGGAILDYYMDGEVRSVVANAQGDYSLLVLPGWSGEVVPSKPGYIFNPGSLSFNDVQANFTNQDFSVSVWSDWSGGLSLTSDQPVVAVGRPHVVAEVMTYNGFGSGATTMYVPMLFKNAFGGGYKAALYVQNISDTTSANVSISYYDSTGALTCSVTNETLTPLASKGYWLPTVGCLPSGWVGGAVVTSDQPVVAVGRPHIGSQVTTYAGFASGSPNMYVPMLFKNAFTGGSYNAALYIQNTDPALAATVDIDFYDADGSLTCSLTGESIAARATKGYWMPSVTCLPVGWVGGAVITSDRPVVAIGRPHIGAQVTTYNGFSSGQTGLRVPMLFKNAFAGGSYNAALYIQNTNPSLAATVDIDFYDSNGNLTCSLPGESIAARATKGYWMPSVSCLPTGWVGGAVISADREVVAVGRPHVGAEVATYGGFATGSTEMYLPMLFKDAFGGSYDSAVYVQNTSGSNPANVTFKFYDTVGNLSCLKTASIPAGATVGYWLPTLTCTP